MHLSPCRSTEERFGPLQTLSLIHKTLWRLNPDTWAEKNDKVVWSVRERIAEIISDSRDGGLSGVTWQYVIVGGWILCAVSALIA